MLGIITLIIFILLAVSMYKDLRSILNPIFLIMFLFFLYLYLTQTAFNNDLNFLYSLLLLIGFVGVPILFLLLGIFLIFNGIVILKKEGKSKVNFLALGLGISIILFYIILSSQIFFKSNIFVDNVFVQVVFFTVILTFVLFVLSFSGYLFYSIIYHFIPKRKKYDFIIIHGAGLIDGVEVTPLLRHRIDKAIKAFKKSKNNDIKLIASGGQGPDEKISEAQAICNYLITKNIPEDKIILEDKSATTYENLKFSKKIGESLVNKPRFLFVTNDYHVFRTSYYAKKLKMRGDGLGCRTAGYYMPSAFIREYIAILVKVRWLFIVIYLVYFAVLALSFSYLLFK